MPTEIHRSEADFADSSTVDTECVVCRKPITLWFNGGELDEARCCGHTYRLEHRRIDFVIERDDTEFSPTL